MAASTPEAMRTGGTVPRGRHTEREFPLDTYLEGAAPVVDALIAARGWRVTAGTSADGWHRQMPVITPARRHVPLSIAAHAIDRSLVIRCGTGLAIPNEFCVHALGFVAVTNDRMTVEAVAFDVASSQVMLRSGVHLELAPPLTTDLVGALCDRALRTADLVRTVLDAVVSGKMTIQDAFARPCG